MTRTRAEHLQWCKERAHQEYNHYKRHEPIKAIHNAVASMLADLNKHSETTHLTRIAFVFSFMVRDQRSLFQFIDGFH